MFSHNDGMRRKKSSPKCAGLFDLFHKTSTMADEKWDVNRGVLSIFIVNDGGSAEFEFHIQGSELSLEFDCGQNR